MNSSKVILTSLLIGLISCGCKMVGGVESVTKAIADNQRAIEESTAGVQAIGQAITNTMPALEAARQAIEEAAQGLAAAGPAINPTMVAVASAHQAIEGVTQATDSAGLTIQAATVALQSAHGTVEKATLATAAAGLAIQTTMAAVEHSSRGIDANRIAIEASTRGIRENAAAVAQSTVAIARIGQLLQDVLGPLDRLSEKRSLFLASIVGAVVLILVPGVVFLVVLWNFSHRMAALATRMERIQSAPQPSFHRDA